MDVQGGFNGWQSPKSRMPQGPDRRVVTWWDQQQARNRAMLHRILAIGLAVLFLIFFITNAGRILQSFREILRDKGPVSGPATSWSTQFSIAQQEAKKIDSSAIQSGIGFTAWPMNSYRRDVSYTSTLELTFEFIGRSDDKIAISFNDSVPTSTLQLKQEQSEEGRYSLIAGNAESVTKAMSGAAISPREAWQLTWQEASAYARQQGLSIYPIIGTDIRKLITDHPYLVWRITYWPVPEDPNDWMRRLGDALSLSYSSAFLVNAETGEIIEREHKDLQANPAP